MTSLLAASVGAQRPQHHLLPSEVVSSAGEEAADLAAAAGLVQDDWQAWVLEGACGERADGSWAAFECGLIVPRQNGKNGILMARELAGIVLFGDDLIIHSAHRMDTTLEHFRNMLQLADEFDELGKLVKKVSHVNGHEGIELKGGRRVAFVSRARQPGRGLSGSMVVLDEAFNLSPALIGSLIPTLATRGGKAQVWYTSSPPHADSLILHSVRTRGRGEGARPEPRLFYAEWCNDDPIELGELTDEQLLPLIAATNPTLGIRITDDYCLSERRLMAAIPGEYLRERLGVAEPLDLALVAQPLPIPLEVWDAALADTAATGPLTYAVDVTPDRRTATIAVAADSSLPGRTHLEVIDHRTGAGTDWVPARLVELLERHGGKVAVNLSGPAGGMETALRKACKAKLQPVSDVDFTKSCGELAADVAQGKVAHPVDDEVREALTGAQKKMVGDAWRWDRRSSDLDISPVVALTLAYHLHSKRERGTVRRVR